jgi:hypothetical protein
MRSLKSELLFLPLILIGAAVASAQVGKIPDELTPIFDGKTTNGWHASHSTRHGTTPSFFVEAGALVLKQHPYGQGGLIFTNKKYRNFDLYIEVKATSGCNSGIFLRSTEEGSAYQIELSQPGGSGALLGEGMRVTTTARVKDLDKIWKNDEWNSIRIRMEGDAPHITEWINGVQVWDVQEPVNDKIAGKTDGYIGVQLHYATVYDPENAHAFDLSGMWKPEATYRFRNIAIKELP